MQHRKRTKFVGYSSSFSRTETVKQWSDQPKPKKIFKNWTKSITPYSDLNSSTKSKPSDKKFTLMSNPKRLMDKVSMEIYW